MSAISSSSVSFNPQATSGIPAGSRRGHHHHHGGGAEFKEAFGAAAQAVGVDPSKVSDLQSQIDSAIQDARQNGNSTDPRAAVRDAINTVLKNNGIDPTKFDAALKAQLDKIRAQQGQPGTPDRANDGDSDDARGLNPPAPAYSINTTA